MPDENPLTSPEPLATGNPLPEELAPRLRTQLGFLIEIDRLKTVLRQSPLAAIDRRENDAEHSWHLAMMVLVLAEYADEPLDLARTLELVLVHDLVEIDAGDTPLYDTAAAETQPARERAAADRLFALLPDDQEARIRAAWEEFEARETPEARFAKAVDRLEPILLNWMARGGTWAVHRPNTAEVRARTAAVAEASASLDAAREAIITHAAANGWIDA